MVGLPCLVSQCAKLHVAGWTWAVRQSGIFWIQPRITEIRPPIQEIKKSGYRMYRRNWPSQFSLAVRVEWLPIRRQDMVFRCFLQPLKAATAVTDLYHVRPLTSPAILAAYNQSLCSICRTRLESSRQIFYVTDQHPVVTTCTNRCNNKYNPHIIALCSYVYGMTSQ
jgi:hypothetical protein